MAFVMKWFFKGKRAIVKDFLNIIDKDVSSAPPYNPAYGNNCINIPRSSSSAPASSPKSIPSAPPLSPTFFKESNAPLFSNDVR